MTDLPKISRPVVRALANIGITSLEGVAKLTEKEFLALHGVGPSAVPIIRSALADIRLEFK